MNVNITACVKCLCAIISGRYGCKYRIYNDMDGSSFVVKLSLSRFDDTLNEFWDANRR